MSKVEPGTVPVPEKTGETGVPGKLEDVPASKETGGPGDPGGPGVIGH